MDQEELDLRRYLGVLLGWWWLLLLGPILAGLVGYTVSVYQTPVYRAEAIVLVQQTRNTASPTLGDIQASLQAAATYEKLITTRRILDDVVKNPELQVVGAMDELPYTVSPLPYTVGELSDMVEASAIRNTQLLRVWARGADNVETARIANAVANAFIERTQEDRLSVIDRLQDMARAQGVSDLLIQGIVDVETARIANEVAGASTQRTQEDRLSEVARLQDMAQAQGISDLIIEGIVDAESIAESIFAAQFTALSSLTLVESAVVPERPIEPRIGLNTLVAAILGILLAIGGAFVLERRKLLRGT